MNSCLVFPYSKVKHLFRVRNGIRVRASVRVRVRVRIMACYVSD